MSNEGRHEASDVELFIVQPFKKPPSIGRELTSKSFQGPTSCSKVPQLRVPQLRVPKVE